MPTATATTGLFNPSAFDAADFDPATQRLFRATIDWFEAKGKTRLTAEMHTDAWYADFIEFLARERAFATLLTPERDAAGDPDKRWDTCTQRHVQRDPRLLRAPVLVRVAGHDPRSRADLAVATTTRLGSAPRPARRRRGLRLWPLRARARRRHLLDRHDPHSGRRRRLPRKRRQVLHRQRQRGRHGCRSSAGAPTSTGPNGYVFFAADSAHPATSSARTSSTASST